MQVACSPKRRYRPTMQEGGNPKDPHVSPKFSSLTCEKVDQTEMIKLLEL